MEKLKTIILLEVFHFITEYPDIKNFIQQKLIEKYNREGILIDQVILFVS